MFTIDQDEDFTIKVDTSGICYLKCKVKVFRRESKVKIVEATGNNGYQESALIIKENVDKSKYQSSTDSGLKFDYMFEVGFPAEKVDFKFDVKVYQLGITLDSFTVNQDSDWNSKPHSMICSETRSSKFKKRDDDE